MEELLECLKTDHELVLTLEDGIVEGGFGQTIASFYGLSDMKVKNYGIKKSFPTDFRPEELMDEYFESKRLEMAKSMLLDSNNTVSVVTEKLGYPNIRYFSRLFKRITGVAPNNYRLSQN